MRLSDKFTVERGTLYLTGIQALVRLPIDQMRRDRRAGLSTGAFISGYEGSPLGGYDLALQAARGLLAEHNVVFQPGVNEDLAATSVMGSQILSSVGRAKVDGVVGIWYGKGPGVDRSGDIFRHANLAGTGENSAALVLAGDDHASKSSTIPHQSDFSLMNSGVPFFFPGNTQEILDYGLLAIALSRYSGAWVGLKMMTDICDGGGTVIVDPDAPAVVLPDGYRKKVDARLVPPITLALEYETNVRRLQAVQSFVRQNRVNVWRGAREQAWLGIASAGKSFYDLMQALRDLGIGPEDLDAMGIRVAKFGMTFPLERVFAHEFADSLETILVVEEKRSFLEMLLRDTLYSSERRPAILGKENAQGAPLFAQTGELNPDHIAKVAGELISVRQGRSRIAARLQRIEEVLNRPAEIATMRPPNFCSGCPHNRSTIIPEGSVAGGGIGCHTMAMRLEDSGRQFQFMTQMGGEGAPWIGMAPFTEHTHVFQNIGDGTFFHSGALAIEACVAAGVNITYKILYNGHVAMTGGQEVAGALPIPKLTFKLEAEGVRRTIVLTEDVEKYREAELAGNAEVRDRSALEKTLKELASIRGVTAMIYDQECAAEKRRKRSRGKLPEPVMRLVIHEEVCEGCGDCVRQSNCMSLTPVDTELGQKMRIHQSSCNKDYSCALGDCPSFVTVRIKEGTGLKRRTLPKLPPAEVPAPREFAALDEGYRILCPGIGGTGVVTINALLATAAWLDGLHIVTLDQTGTAQKGGAVVSHLLLSRDPLEAPARTNLGNADVILGFDLIGAANPENLKCASPEKTVAVINTNVAPTIDVVRGRLAIAGPERMLERVNASTLRGRNITVDASRLAEGLFGTHLAVNLFVTGVAWQGGLIPISLESIEQAIRLNGVEVERNLEVFLWGRKYYHDAAWVESQVTPRDRERVRKFDPGAELTAYQNVGYAREYAAFLNKVEHRAPEIAAVVSRNLYKLMAAKDEYEVARLLTGKSFESRVRETFEAVESISYNLHPPLLRRFGVTRKMKLGAWFRPALSLLAWLKFVRGTPLDVFGWTAHRRLERSLPAWYRSMIERIIDRVHDGNRALALEIAALPDQIRGYEQIKEKSIARVKQMAEEKLAELEQTGALEAAK